MYLRFLDILLSFMVLLGLFFAKTVLLLSTLSFNYSLKLDMSSLQYQYYIIAIVQYFYNFSSKNTKSICPPLKIVDE